MSQIDSDGPDMDRLVSMLREDERLRSVLESMVAYQREYVEDGEPVDRWVEHDHVGFEASDVGMAGWEVKKLSQVGLLTHSYNSSNSSEFRLGKKADDGWEFYTQEAERALELADPEQPIEQGDAEWESVESIDVHDLFTDVVGREDPKRWFRRTIDRQAQVHHLLHGPPGGGKSELLDDILALPGADRVVFSGEQTSAAGLTDLLLQKRPTFLVVEELEKGAKRDREALMTLTGKGYIERTKADVDQPQRIELDTIVFATANDPEAVTPRSLRDRFMEWHFPQYDDDEFVEVCREVLPREYCIDVDLAESIARTLYARIDCTQVREAKRVASLVESEDEVEELVTAMS